MLFCISIVIKKYPLIWVATNINHISDIFLISDDTGGTEERCRCKFQESSEGHEQLRDRAEKPA